MGPTVNMAGKTKQALSRHLLLGLMALPGVAGAATAELSADVGVGRTDNIARVSSGERSETIRSAGVEFALLQQTRRLSADVVGDLEWFDYARNTYDSELVANAAAALRVSLVEDRLNWTVDDTFGQTRRDLFTVETPANRENVNYFSTGPNLRFGLGGTLHFTANARYTLVDYEDSPFDSKRVGGMVGLENELSSGSTLGLQLDRERIEPRGAAVFADYDRSEAYVRYSATAARTTLAADAGASRVHQDSGNDSGALLRLELSRKVGSLSTFSVKLGREFTDVGSAMRLNTAAPLPTANLNTQSLTQSMDPYVSKYVDLVWRIVGRRTSLGFTAARFDESYLGRSTQDRRRTALGASATRDLTARLRATAGLRRTRYDFRNIIGDNSETSADLSLAWLIGRRLSVELSGNHLRYSSDIATLSSTETRYWLRLRYGNQPGSGRASP